MMPIIHQKDKIEVIPTTLNQLKINDLAVFKEKNKIIAHRVIFKTKKFIITKGDNNPFNDGKIYKRQILGKVGSIIRKKNVYTIKQIYLIQSAIYYKEILNLKILLEKLGIDYIFLKGLPLHLFYQRFTPQRIYYDCDLLIHRSDFIKINKIMKKLNFKRFNTSFDKKNHLPISQQVEISFFKMVNNIPVVFDIHFQPVFLMTQLPFLETLYSKKLLDQMTNDMFKNTQRVIINDEKFTILNKKYLIIYLALHFFHHNYQGLFRLDLLKDIIKKEKIKKNQWLEIAQLIKNYQINNFVYPSFKILKKYSFIKIPQAFFDSLSLNKKQLERYSNINIFSDKSRLDEGVNRFITIFNLSPYSFIKKIFVFINPKVIYFIFFFLKEKLISFLKEN